MLRITADSFCQQMVRSVTGMSVEVGRGRIDPETVPSLLAARDRSAVSQVAPPQGLILWEVGYDAVLRHFFSMPAAPWWSSMPRPWQPAWNRWRWRSRNRRSSPEPTTRRPPATRQRSPPVKTSPGNGGWSAFSPRRPFRSRARCWRHSIAAPGCGITPCRVLWTCSVALVLPGSVWRWCPTRTGPWRPNWSRPASEGCSRWWWTRMSSGSPNPIRRFSASPSTNSGLAPVDAWHVGDSPHHDLDGAAAAGLARAVLVDPLHKRPGHPWRVGRVADLGALAEFGLADAPNLF